MKSVCLEHRCIKCCLETEMPLSNSDISRIKNLGFSEDHFILEDRGELRLRNHRGRCVFHDGQGCTIYNNRPEGCQTYPLVYDPYNERVVLHDYCPHETKFRITTENSRTVVNLIKKLDLERQMRFRSKHQQAGTKSA